MHDIHIKKEGSGFPLVLIHGFLGSSETLRPQVDFFKEYYKVITIDLPGFGKSNKATPLTDIKSYANFVFECLDKIKVKRFHLLGHSMGGMIVQTMASSNGSNIEKLICHSTGPIGEMPERFETIDQSRENLKKNGLENMTKNIVKFWFISKNKSKHFKHCLKIANQTNLNAADSALIAMKKWNGVKNLEKINNETLIIWGDKDKSYTFDQIKLLNEKIKKSKLIVIRDCAHNVHLESVKEFNRAIKEFLNN